MSGIGTVAHHHHHDLGPSYPGTVMLDIGAGRGALVISAAAEQLGLEIEISPGESGDAPRTHAAVRARVFDSSRLYAVVFPSLAEGPYTIWSEAGDALATVRVRSAEVTQFTWPA
ncbi:phospholipase [Dactylosporangium sp. NPDC051541]|uniref:phospholipase n=1 Tax=Dactylosporangium sp. NPDC051541 TaxID=3363977 RepID=UPI00379FC5EC